MNKERNPQNALISSFLLLFLAPVSNEKQHSLSFEGKAYHEFERVPQSRAVRAVSRAT